MYGCNNERDGIHDLIISGFRFHVYKCDSRDIFEEMIVGMGFRFYLYMYDSKDIFVETS